jgi:chemotaxis protein methyltransferase CheR
MTAMTSAKLGVSDPDLVVIAGYVESRSAILCPADKHYLFEARLRPVLRQHGLTDMHELAQKLRSGTNSPLGEDVVDAMTTNETSWFRDIHPFDTLRQNLLPELMATKTNRTLNIWSAACSTGQELYSLAMMMDLQMPQLQGWDVRLHGTDLSREVIDQAKAGRYSALEVNRGLPAQYLARYMTRDGAHYVVSEQLRRRATWERLNFIAPWPIMPRFDVVLCRNVLIYFDLDVRARIIRKIRDTLTPGGYLLLGSSETSIGDVEGFSRHVIGRTTVYRKEHR